MPVQQEQEIGAVASKRQLHPFEGDDDKWRERARVFRSCSGRFFGGALAEIYEQVEGHRNDSAIILDLTLSSSRFDAGLLRNVSTELCHVLIMLTEGRSQELVLKAAEPEGLEAYRFLLRRYEPISTVTTVSILVDLLASTFSGDRIILCKVLRDESHPGSMMRKKYCKIRSRSESSSKAWRRVVFDHLLIKTAGTTEWTKFVKEIENV